MQRIFGKLKHIPMHEVIKFDVKQFLCYIQFCLTQLKTYGTFNATSLRLRLWDDFKFYSTL